MHMQICVRPATANDIPAICDITHEAFAKYARDLGLPEKVTALKEDMQAVVNDLTAKHVFVGELDGEPLGSIRYEILESGFGYISRFGVKLAAQGCGMGRALIQAVVKDCLSNGVKVIALHTSARMSSLIRFYYGQGFFIHSTSTERGYVRALLIKELEHTDAIVDYCALLPPAL